MTGLNDSRQDDEAGVGVLAVIQGRPAEWVDSLRTLRELNARVVQPIRVASLDLAGARKYLASDGVQILDEWALSSAARRFLEDREQIDSLLVVLAPVSVSPDLLNNALTWLGTDPRIATVSFLSNAAGPYSFPFRNTPTPYPLKGLDERGVTRMLRNTRPPAGCVPIAMPAGSAVLVSRAALGVLGAFDAELDANPAESLAEFALRASRRGFQHRLDPDTYVTSQWFTGFPAREAVEDPDVRHHLHVRDASFPAVYDDECTAQLSPLTMALDVARAKVEGLRILIDGACLGPLEMGTQVQTLAVIQALVAREDVVSVGVAVPNGVLPDYAKGLLVSSKIRVYDSSNLVFEGAEYADILHRPFQPDRAIPWDRWRSLAKRLVVTIQDLIAYRIGAYHGNGGEWLAYRRCIQDAAHRVDAVIAISEDTKAAILEERLGVLPDRIHTITNGSDHLGGQAEEKIPSALLEHGQAAANFILVLGATYAHKNRDLAIRVWQELSRRGHKLTLVMAGASVVLGSSRTEEALVRRDGGGERLITMPDVSGAERTWLLRHAAMVLYPTMAEGFGLVPFEAAALGTPTAFVGFGPLKEMLSAEWLPKDWSQSGLADYSERILVDREFSERLIRLIKSKGESLTWAGTAAGLVEAYRTALAAAPKV